MENQGAVTSQSLQTRGPKSGVELLAGKKSVPVRHKTSELWITVSGEQLDAVGGHGERESGASYYMADSESSPKSKKKSEALRNWRDRLGPARIGDTLFRLHAITHPRRHNIQAT